MPFLLGMNSDWMDEMFHEEIMSQVDDVVILDIDHSIITVPAHPKMPSLPSRERKKLEKQLQETADPVFKNRGQGMGDEIWRNDLGAVRLCISVCGASM